MSSKRRYKITPETVVYHREFDAARLSSNILNSGGQTISIYSRNLSDREGLTALLFELQGYKEDHFYHPTELRWVMAAIPSLKEELEQTEKQFERFKQQRKDMGRGEPKEWPKELMEQRYKIEAVLDVREEEAETIRKWLAEIAAKAEQQRERKILKDGIRCTGQIRGGRLVMLDGQLIGTYEDEDGEETYFIDDPKSKYNGLSVRDYTALHTQVVEHRKAHRKKWKEDKKAGKTTKGYPFNYRGPLPPKPKNAIDYSELKKQREEQINGKLEEQIKQGNN